MRVAGKTLVDFSLVLGGRFSNLAVLFLAGLLVARVAGPEAYGVFAVALSMVLLGDGLIGAPLDLGAVRFFALHPGEEERTRRFEAMALQIKAILAVIVFLAFLVMRSVAGRWWPALSASGFPLVPCFVALAGLLAARSTATGLQNRQRFRWYSGLDLAQALARTLGFLGLAWLQLAEARPFLWVQGVVALMAATAGWTLLRQQYLLGPWPPREDAKRMLVYCGYTSGVVALGTLTGRGDLLLLAARQGAGGSATYALASQLAMLLAQVAMYASVLTQPRVLGLHRQAGLRRLFLFNLAAVAGGAGLALAFWNPVLIAHVLTQAFGPAFGASVPLLQILLLGVVLDWLIVPVLMVFGIQTRPGTVFLGELLIAVAFLIAGATAVAWPWPWSAELMLAWIAVAGRVAKLAVYGTLFFRQTAAPRETPATVAAP